MVNIKQDKTSKKLVNSQAEELARYTAILSACELKTRDDETEYYALSDKCPEDLQDIFLKNFEVQDIDYNIFYRACSFFGDYSIEDIKNEDTFETALYDYEFMSCYNSDRLSVLNIWNEDDISKKMKESLGCSISEACAMWFDDECRQAVGLLKDYIFSSHD